jgi:hypothetical protein
MPENSFGLQVMPHVEQDTATSVNTNGTRHAGSSTGTMTRNTKGSSRGET